ncbi:hypothetical protein [Clostridium lundense]|uniref:hypothetical protein n=1 Tax=Clostridium lundense TaxID=319475 RepID=UPI000480B6B0|nr:hypothetical protein [Clostridium lundense]
MFKRNSVIEIDDEYIYLNDYGGRKLLRKNIKEGMERKIIGDRNELKNLKVNIQKRNIHFILNGEKVFVKLITIPKVKKSYLDKVIRGEIEYYFKDIDNLIYSYSIYKEGEKSIEVLVFCLNWKEIDMLKNIEFNKNSVKGVWLIQFCFLNFFMKSFKEKQFIFTFIHNYKTYLIACKDNKLICNNIINNYDENTFIKYLKDFIEHSSRKMGEQNLNAVYFVNFKNKDLIKESTKYYECKDLGSVGRDDIIKKFIYMGG